MGALEGLKNWLVGGSATQGLPTGTAHNDYMAGYLQNQLNTVGNRAAPQANAYQLGAAAQLNGQREAQARAQQDALAGRLGQIALGQTAGAGELTVNRQVGQATAAQQAAARMARGANAALAARNAARNTADIGVAGAGQASIAQMQDQQGANNQLAGLLGQMRGQDVDVASQNAQLLQQRNLMQGQFGQQANLANQNAALQQTQLNQNAQMGYLAQLLGLDQAQLQQLMAVRGMSMQDTGHLGQLLQAGAGIGAAFAGGGMG